MKIKLKITHLKRQTHRLVELRCFSMSLAFSAHSYFGGFIFMDMSVFMHLKTITLRK